MSGPVHHQPVTAGVFVPGLAQAELRDPDMSHLMRQRTLTLGQSSSQESLAALPSPRQLFTPQSSNEALSPPARMASPVQPVLGTLPSQLSLASTMQYPAAAASPAQTLADPATPVPTVVTIPSPSMERVWPDNQLGDSQVNPPTPPFEPLPATLSSQQQSQQHLSGNNVPAVPAATTPAQQALLAPVNQTPSAAPAASTTPAQQASPAPVNQTPPTAPAASTTPVQQVPPGQASQSSAVTGADKAPVTPSQSTGGDGSGQPDMTSTMYTDGTYWKTLVCKYSKHHPFYHSNMCGLLWT